jgi:hypothetical protein
VPPNPTTLTGTAWAEGSVIKINGKPGPTGAGNTHMAQGSTRTSTTPDTHPPAPSSVLTDIGTQHAPEKIYGKRTLFGRIFATGNGTKMRQRPAGPLGPWVPGPWAPV